MTSITSVNNAALLILKQANASALNDDRKTTPTDKITAIANTISSENSAAKTQAAAKINSSFLNAKQAESSIVSNALEFLDSDRFKSSDPSVKDALKQLISEDGWKLDVLVKAEKARNPQISTDNAIANAIQGLIRGNRDKFTDDEFVIGFRLSGGGSILANIEDKDGYSTSKTLDERNSANSTESGAALRSFVEAGKDQTKLTNSEGERLNASMNSFMSSLNELGCRLITI